MTDPKASNRVPEEAKTRHLSRPEWVALILGIGNFFLVTVLGAFTSCRTEDLESRLSTVQTAAQYIQIIANRSAPDYAKGMALNAIFNQGLLSKDQLLDTAYRIEDDSLERTMVGQIFYEIANTEERLLSPFGYIEDVKIRQNYEGNLELIIRGWGVDDDGWIPAKADGPNLYLVVELNDELVCSFPVAKGIDCGVRIFPRPDIFAAFSQYPGSELAGFDVRLPLKEDGQWPRHLVIALRDQDHRGRIIYSRCVAVRESEPLEVGQEQRLKESRYDNSCGHMESEAP